MIEDLCERIKNKRRELGYGLEDVVEGTKLHPSVIKAIEDCRLDEISPVYLKGFIKLYASFLGIAVGDELKAISFAKTPYKLNHSDEKLSDKKLHKHKVDFIKLFTPKVKRNVIFISVLFVAFIIIFILIFSIVRLMKYKPSSSVSKNNVTKSAGTKAVTPNKSKGVAVSLKVRRDCFIRVKRDGRVVFEGVLRKGVVESWQASKELEFSINDGSSVIVEVNGRILPPLSKIYKPIKSLKITPKGISIVK